MKELSDLGTAIEEDTAKADLKEIIAEQGDIAIEALVGSIPGLSFIAKLSMAYSSVKDFFLMQKVYTFLTELSTMPEDKRKNLVDKINADPIFGQKFGAFLVTALDRQDFATKSVYLARACKFYERGDISRSVFIRLKGIIEKIELEDLKNCRYHGYDYAGYPEKFDHPALFLFQALGLITIESTISAEQEYNQLRAAGIRDVTKPRDPYLTKLGKTLLHIINDFPIN